MIQYTRLITSSHYLRSETGRWRHPVIPRNDRLCTCGPYVQDENHVLSSCNLTFNIRQKCALTNKTIEDIYNLDPKLLGTFISEILTVFS